MQWFIVCRLPCRWQGEHIIVTDAVVISPPYTEKEVGLAPGVDAAVFGDTFKRVQMMVGTVAECMFNDDLQGNTLTMFARAGGQIP